MNLILKAARLAKKVVDQFGYEGNDLFTEAVFVEAYNKVEDDEYRDFCDWYEGVRPYGWEENDGGI